MTFKVFVHQAEEGGYWAEVPSLPGCITEADTLVELKINLKEAIKGYLGLGDDAAVPPDVEVLEIAV